MRIKSFRALKAEWYQKLEDDGFRDIENGQGSLKSHNTRTVSFDFRDDIRDYFIALDHYITENEDHIPDSHVRVLKLHSAGIHRVKIQEIVKFGETKVKKILRHYREIILGKK